MRTQCPSPSKNCFQFFLPAFQSAHRFCSLLYCSWRSQQTSFFGWLQTTVCTGSVQTLCSSCFRLLLNFQIVGCVLLMDCVSLLFHASQMLLVAHIMTLTYSTFYIKAFTWGTNYAYVTATHQTISIWTHLIFNSGFSGHYLWLQWESTYSNYA